MLFVTLAPRHYATLHAYVAATPLASAMLINADTFHIVLALLVLIIIALRCYIIDAEGAILRHTVGDAATRHYVIIVDIYAMSTPLTQGHAVYIRYATRYAP